VLSFHPVVLGLLRPRSSKVWTLPWVMDDGMALAALQPVELWKLHRLPIGEGQGGVDTTRLIERCASGDWARLDGDDRQRG